MKIVYDPEAKYIQTSNKGVRFIHGVLRKKPNVVTKAVLERIPHHHADNDTFALRIARFDIKDGWEKRDPKCEIHLDDEELHALIAFIESNFGALKTGADSFIPLNGKNDIGVLLKRFKSLAANNLAKAKALIDSGVITGDISSAIEHSSRVKALDAFKNALEKDEPESYWQEWFENNKWMLGSEFAKILDERKIDTEHIADYLMKSDDGFLDIVEIKKPNGMSFWSNSLDHNNHVPSTELIKALTQCRNYLHKIDCKSDSKEFDRRVAKTPIASPRCLLVFGRSNDWDEDKQLAFRLLNSSLNRITILTYDQLYKRAANMIGISGDSSSDVSERPQI